MAERQKTQMILEIERRLEYWLREDDCNEMGLDPQYQYTEETQVFYNITSNMAFLIALHQRNREAG